MWRSFLSGTIVSLLVGIAAPAAAQLVNASGRVTVNINPAQLRSLRKPATYSSPLSSITATATDAFSSEVDSTTKDGWPESLTISVTPPNDPGFKIQLNGGQANIVSGAYCETPGGRTVCDPSVTLLTAGGEPICAVRKSSFTISKARFGFPLLGSLITEPFVYSVAGTYSVQCIGEASAFTGTFSLNQTTTTKFDTQPRSGVDSGTARCDGAGGWPTVGVTTACSTLAPTPTSNLPRSGKITLTLTAEKGSSLGGLVPNKTYRWSNTDGPWHSFLRDPRTDDSARDYAGAAPSHLDIKLEPQGSSRDLTGVFHLSVKNRHTFDGGIQLGSFEFTDVNELPHFEIQINLQFCSGGVSSTYDITDFTYDCEFAPGGLPGVLGEPDKVVHVVPHLRTLNVNFKTTCGKEGTYRGTLNIVDDPIFDCGFPPASGGGGDTGGGDGSGDLGGGTGGGTGGSGGGGTSGGGGGTTPAGAPRVSIPASIATDGIQLNNLQSATVNLTTSIPANFDAPVELAAFSEPEGLAVSLSPSAIAAPGTGSSVLTITAGAETRPQEYRIILSATGNGVTSYNVVKVTVLCDPPMILGLDQPKSVSVNAGSSTTLEVKTIGSAPTAYQWYRGQSGSTANPISGATGRTFTTSAAGDYWVRATNPCGSVDSNTATVTLK